MFENIRALGMASPMLLIVAVIVGLIMLAVFVVLLLILIPVILILAGLYYMLGKNNLAVGLGLIVAGAAIMIISKL